YPTLFRSSPVPRRLRALHRHAFRADAGSRCSGPRVHSPQQRRRVDLHPVPRHIGEPRSAVGRARTVADRNPRVLSRSRRARIAAGRGAMNRARVVVTDHAFGDTARERAMAGELGAEFLEYACRTEEETIDAVAGAAVVFVNFAPITRA